MVRLAPSQYPAVHALYLHHGAYFPLIASVLSGEQDGVVHADREESPTQVYVEHTFGFAQVFGAPAPLFEQALQRYWLIDKAFACTKVRLYTPHCPDFLQAHELEGLRSWRQHFQLDAPRRANAAERSTEPQLKGLTLVHAGFSQIDLIENAFGVVSRFWRTPDDFAKRSNAVLALVDGQPAALCYAAAVADGKAEIDVLTLPTHRHLGLAKAVVRLFNQRCLAQNVQPLWDCFTNNTASMALCQSVGFVPLGDPYPFFTINR
jgi:GNAT superfamily N-acetyltransferase